MSYEIQVINTAEPDVPDDLLVCCSSFEKRSVVVAGLLADGYRCVRSAVLDYGPSPELRGTEGLSQPGVLAARLREVSAVAPEVIACARGDASRGVAEVDRVLRRIGVPRVVRNITVDISSLNKQYQLCLLRLLDSSRRFGKLQVVYTAPGEYKPKMLTKGVLRITSVPGCEGTFDPRKRKALITFLGFDRDRALCVWNHLEPEKTIPIVGFHGTRPTWTARAREHNASLLSKPGVAEPLVFPCYDPFEVWRRLADLYGELAAEFNVAIMPLGTKPQVLGLFLLLSKTLANVKVIYPVPFRYTKYYTERGVGATYRYDL